MITNKKIEEALKVMTRGLVRETESLSRMAEDIDSYWEGEVCIDCFKHDLRFSRMLVSDVAECLDEILKLIGDEKETALTK